MNNFLKKYISKNETTDKKDKDIMNNQNSIQTYLASNAFNKEMSSAKEKLRRALGDEDKVMDWNLIENVAKEKLRLQDIPERDIPIICLRALARSMNAIYNDEEHLEPLRFDTDLNASN